MKTKTKATKDAALVSGLRTVGYIVTQDGKPCTIANVSGLRRGGVLLPGAPVAFFLKPRDARRAADRTTRCIDALRGSMIETWARDKAPSLFTGGTFVVEPIGRQS